MIHDILDTSRLSLSSENEKAVKIDLSEMFSVLCEPYILIAKAKRILFRIELPENCWAVLPQRMFKKTVSNILANAVAYTKAGKTVTVYFDGQKLMIENIATYAKIENQIFIDYDTLQEFFRDTPVGFISAKFLVDDSADLETIANRIKESSEIDWQAFTLITNNKEYQQAVAQFEKLQSLVTSIIFVTALVSGVILALILTMWGRSRIHEMGVFLSLGIGKSKIIGQYLLEALMIVVIAFGLSLFTSNAAANQIANGLIESPSNEENSSWPGI